MARTFVRASFAAAVVAAAAEQPSWTTRLRAMLRGGSSEPISCSDSKAPGLGDAAWEPLTTLLSQWKFTDNFAVAVGTQCQGRVFVYEHGNFSMHTPVETASTSKWPSAMMLAGLVNDGTIKSLDTKVNTILPWWTKDPNDKRSLVTLRHLLTFTSGFGDGHPGTEADSAMARMKLRKAKEAGAKIGGLVELYGQEDESTDACASTGSIMECAQSIYNGVKLVGTPGEVYSYNSYHLQLAGAVAVQASGLTIQGVINKYLFQPYGFNESSYPGSNPMLAVDLHTTGADYEKFLYGVLSYNPLSVDIVDQSEIDATPFQKDYYSLYGDYGFGHFLMCFDSTAGFTKECSEARTHIDPGAFGFFPAIDRRLNYYFEVVAYESGIYYPRSGIPEYLALAIKPLIDSIIQGQDVSQTAMHHTPAFNGLSLVDVNYVAGCYVDPVHSGCL